MTQNILLETAIEFIRRDRKHAKLARLVARAVPVLRDRINREIREQVERELRKFCDRPKSKWELARHWGGKPKVFERLRLHKKAPHWSAKPNHGIWFCWMRWWETPRWRVGVQGHREGPPNLSEEELRAMFPPGTAGQDQGSWFCGQPTADDWLDSGSLLAKTEEEIRQFAEAVGDLMARLAEVIDRTDET